MEAASLYQLEMVGNIAEMIRGLWWLRSIFSHIGSVLFGCDFGCHDTTALCSRGGNVSWCICVIIISWWQYQLVHMCNYHQSVVPG